MVLPNHPSKIRWLLPEKLAKSCIPDYSDLIVWHNMGITSIVNLLEEWYYEVAEDEDEVGFNVMHSPVPDFYGPTLEQLHRIVEWINKEITAGNKVLVHCYAGIGRTGVVLTAYLLYKGHDLARATDAVSSIGSGPQSFEQQEIIEQYYHYIQDKNPK